MPTSAVRDLEMYWERHGPVGADRVLYINGTNGDLRLIPGLGSGPLERTFDALYYDQRGLGQTSIPEGPYTMADYADDAAALLDVFGWDNCHVIGVSFGGMVAQEFALRHPARVNRLVLCCTSSGGAGGASFDLLGIADLPTEQRLRISQSVLDSRNDMSTDPPTWAPGFAAIAAGMATRPAPTHGARLQLGARSDHDTWDRLPSLDIPTLVIGGTYDLQAPVENVARLAERIPGAELVWCDGGHLFMVQDRTAWPTILGFLARA